MSGFRLVDRPDRLASVILGEVTLCLAPLSLLTTEDTKLENATFKIDSECHDDLSCDLFQGYTSTGVPEARGRHGCHLGGRRGVMGRGGT